MANVTLYTSLNVRSRGKQFCFPSRHDVSLDFVSGNIRTRGKTKLTGFPKDLTLSVLFVILLLDFHLYSNKRITGANQNSRLGTYNNPNLKFNS